MYLYNYSSHKIDDIKPNSIIEIDNKEALKYFKNYFGEVFIFEHKITVKKAKEFAENTSFIFNYFNESIKELKGLIINEANRATKDTGKLRLEVRKRIDPKRYECENYPIETLEDKYSYQYLDRATKNFENMSITINNETKTLTEWCNSYNQNYDSVIEFYVSNSDKLKLTDISKILETKQREWGSLL